jgi:hypothetical protein
VSKNNPVVKITDTKPNGNGWCTDGTVTFTLAGEHAPTASLTFEFVNAPNHKAAIQQAASRLLEATQAFHAMAQNYRQ